MASPAMQSLIHFAPLAFTPPFTLAAAAAVPGQCAGGAPFAFAAAVAGAPDTLVLIPDSLRRRVFVVDPATLAWRWAGDSTGPATGTRFVLAAVDTTGNVTMPLTASGALNISDQSTDAQWIGAGQVGTAPDFNALFTTAVTLIAGRIITVSAGSFAAAGATANFLDSAVENGQTLAVRAHVNSPAQHWSLGLTASHTTYDPADNTYVFEVTFTREDEELRLMGTVYTYCYYATTDFAVTVNGTAFGSYHRSTFGQGQIDPAGSPLTPQQSQAIFDLLAAQRRLFEAVRAMHEPIANLLRL